MCSLWGSDHWVARATEVGLWIDTACRDVGMLRAGQERHLDGSFHLPPAQPHLAMENVSQRKLVSEDRVGVCG